MIVVEICAFGFAGHCIWQFIDAEIHPFSLLMMGLLYAFIGVWIHVLQKDLSFND